MSKLGNLKETYQVSSFRSVQTTTSNVPDPMAVKKKALLDLKELLDAGILSQEEFDVEKSRILKG